MNERRQITLWSTVTLVVIGLAVPWFMWGSDAVVAGLPVWLWWHIGWLALASIVFYVFTRRAWGLGIEKGGHRG